ncbi:hypothetical protein [Burkholderia ubonensis]|uniref:hypothetical protein n=1 Tax=Burkholderia ubonensis TaxID=101571 RepID=UPI0011609A94|nr:hypothetical protein [Burkholderia ubonensis]
MSWFFEQAKHTWAVILLASVPVGALVAFLVNVATLRRAARERQKLDLEIAKLRADAERAAQERIKLELEINRLRADANSADRRVVSADLIQMEELVRLRDRSKLPLEIWKPGPLIRRKASSWWRIVWWTVLTALVMVLSWWLFHHR